MNITDNPLDTVVIEIIKSDFVNVEIKGHVSTYLYDWDFFIDGVVYYLSSYQMLRLMIRLGLGKTLDNAWDFCSYRNKPPTGEGQPDPSSFTNILLLNRRNKEGDNQ